MHALDTSASCPHNTRYFITVSCNISHVTIITRLTYSTFFFFGIFLKFISAAVKQYNMCSIHVSINGSQTGVSHAPWRAGSYRLAALLPIRRLQEPAAQSKGTTLKDAHPVSVSRSRTAPLLEVQKVSIIYGRK